MPRTKVTLLDRAKFDLRAAKLVLADGGDDGIIDVAAYHCQQCVEKVVKYLIVLQGDTYANDHRSDIYLEDLNDENIKNMVSKISHNLDSWATTIRYSKTILSNRRTVSEAIEICESLIELAEKKEPKQIGSNDVDNAVVGGARVFKASADE